MVYSPHVRTSVCNCLQKTQPKAKGGAGRTSVILAKAGIQVLGRIFWIQAFAGMTGQGVS